MGADIHAFPEVFKNEKWQIAEPFVFSSWWYDVIAENDEGEWDEISKKYEAMSKEEILEKYGDDPRLCWEHPFDRHYTSRNYDFFAVMADVRNYDNFITPVCAPKGFPEDASQEVINEYKRWNEDAHSCSWLTLEELELYDWEKEKTDSGLVDPRQFLEYLKNGRPSVWSGGTSGVKVDHNTMKNICRGIYGLLDPNKWYVTRVFWQESVKEGIGELYLEEFLSTLRNYGKNVRIVFWFDN